MALGCVAIVLSPLQSPVAYGQTYTPLYSFSGPDGKAPCGTLTLSADGSTLFGTTQDGGTSGYGTVFSIATTGGTPTTLVSFNIANGEPEGSLALSGTTLYGTTSHGRTGEVFSLATSGGGATALLSLTAPRGQGIGVSSLTLSADGSTLYGMLNVGGTYGDGTIFSVATTGGTPKTLFSFNSTDGESGGGGLTLSGSTLYGMTTYSGTNGVAYGGYGTIFSIATTGGALTTLLSFNSTDGATRRAA